MFTIGSDIEFAVLLRGKPMSAEHVIRGTKHEPIRLPGGYLLSHDNVLAEVATPVAMDEDDFVSVVGQSLRMLGEACAGMELSGEAAVEFDDASLNTPTAMEFGCDPDYDIWDLMENEPPIAIGNKWRSCGGHVHVGGRGAFKTQDGVVNLGRWMDAILGSTMTSLYDNTGERIRRRLYGRSGCVRQKPYGVEYRTLSNAWPQTEASTRAVYRLTADSVLAMESGIRIEWFVDKDLLRNAINSADSRMASELSDALMAAGIISNNSYEMVKECRSM